MKVKKLFIICFIMSIIVLNPFTKVYADDTPTNGKSSTIGEIIDGLNPNNPNNPTNDEIINGKNGSKSRLFIIMKQAFTAVQYIGTGISIIMVMWSGITYMTASIDKKAELKKKLVPICIGSILIVSTVNILKFLSILINASIIDTN